MSEQSMSEQSMSEQSMFDQQPPAAHQADAPIQRVRRSRQDRVIGGVCGGLGQYLRVDPVLLRIAAVALALSGGLGILAYIIAWIVIPEETGAEPVRAGRSDNRHGLAVAVGAGLVGLGALLLVREWVPWFSAAFFWPAVVVAVGVAVLASAKRR
jgi:phage shock protein C